MQSITQWLLLPRCEVGTYKHCYKNAMHPPSPNFTSAQRKRHNFKRDSYKWALFIFAAVAWKSTNVRWQETGVVQLVQVDWRCAIWLRFSCWNASYANQGNEAGCSWPLLMLKNCSRWLLPLVMWALKLSAVSSYMPCLGSGAFGGSSSDSGSWTTQEQASMNATILAL